MVIDRCLLQIESEHRTALKSEQQRSKQEVERLTRELKDATRQLEHVEYEYESARQDLKELGRDHKRVYLNSEARGTTQVDYIKEKLTGPEVKSTLRNLERQNEKLREQVLRAEEESDKHLHAREAAELRVKELEKELEIKRVELGKVDSERVQIEKKLQQRVEELQRRVEQREDSAGAESALSGRVERLQEQVESKASEVEYASKQVSALQEEVRQLKNKLTAVTRDFTARLDDERKTSRDLENEQRHLLAQLEESKRQVENERRAKTSVDRVVEQLKGQQATLQTKVDELEKHNSKLSKSLRSAATSRH